MADDIMTIKEVASYLRLAEKSLYRYAQEGKVPGFRIGAAWRFRRSDIDNWISQNIAEQMKAS